MVKSLLTSWLFLRWRSNRKILRDCSFAGSHRNSGRFQDGFSCRPSINLPFAMNHGRYMSSVKEGIRQGDFLFFKWISVLFLGRHMQKSKKSNLHSSFINKSCIESPELNSRAKLCSQTVNLPSAWPLMNPLSLKCSCHPW